MFRIKYRLTESSDKNEIERDEKVIRRFNRKRFIRGGQNNSRGSRCTDPSVICSLAAPLQLSSAATSLIQILTARSASIVSVSRTFNFPEVQVRHVLTKNYQEPEKVGSKFLFDFVNKGVKCLNPVKYREFSINRKLFLENLSEFCCLTLARILCVTRSWLLIVVAACYRRHTVK